MSLSRLLIAGAAVCLSGVSGVRTSRKHAQKTKMIGSTPILNYDMAYQGAQSFAENGQQIQDWVMVVKKNIGDTKLVDLCAMSTCVRVGHPDLKGMPFMQIRGTEKDLEKIIMSADGAVEFAEPDVEIHATPEFRAQAEDLWGLERVGVDKAWNTGKDSYVYVLDTGVRVSHDDFEGRAAPVLDMAAQIEGGELVLCEEDDYTCAADRQGHGTHCAGTVGGHKYGVAKEATIRAIKVLSDEGSGVMSWSYDALDWLAVNHEKPAVASMSLGANGVLQAMKAAVDSAVDAGVTVVVAGGNENTDACTKSPAFVPSAITVGSIAKGDIRSSFSNYGSCTDIWAPGSDIISASHQSDTGSVSLSGTSMACPHVSGGSAILLAEQPTLTPANLNLWMLNLSSKGYIRGLKYNDDNSLLYVGNDGPLAPAPPTPAPLPCPQHCSTAGFFCQFFQDCSSLMCC